MLALFVHDLVQRLDEVSPSAVDRAFCVAICLTYMTTLLLSVVYHTFNCHSEQCYQRLLKWDVLGVALSLSMTFLSGVHFAFSCRPWLELAYSGVEVLLVAVVLVLNFAPRFAGREDVEPARLLVLSSLVLFGLVPTAHWFALNGGFEAPIVRLLLPRIAVLFGLIGMAFAVYRFKDPRVPLARPRRLRLLESPDLARHRVPVASVVARDWICSFPLHERRTAVRRAHVMFLRLRKRAQVSY
ncbi:hypothetical protein MRX96_039785 [Rhipicephalus microplus]